MSISSLTNSIASIDREIGILQQQINTLSNSISTKSKDANRILEPISREKSINRVVGANESVAAFKARVSGAMRDDEYQQEGHEDWVLGSQVRDKGCIHKDYWEGRTVDLVLKNKIAVYPVSDWWCTWKKLGRYDDTIRHSSIVNVLTPDVDIDIYTAVVTEINIPI